MERPQAPFMQSLKDSGLSAPKSSENSSQMVQESASDKTEAGKNLPFI
jgi:hypothetical protein